MSVPDSGLAAAQPSGLEVPPDLPVTVYYATERWHPERIGALALYCSDGRWGEAFDEFCHKHLQIPRYDRLAVPGGPAWLAPPGEDRTLLDVARKQLDFLVRVHQLEQMVLITHYGCAAYAERLHRAPGECLPRQLEDVKAAAAVLHKWYPQLHVEGYLAMRRDNCLSFHEVST